MVTDDQNKFSLPEDWKRHRDLPWRERTKIAASLGELMREGHSHKELKSLFTALSEDPKWEVRRAVADQLVGIQADLVVPLLAKLLSDPNRDVQISASRVQRKVRHGKAFGSGSESEAATAEELFTQLEGKIGKNAAMLARETADKQIEMLISPVVHDIKNAIQSIMSGAGELCGVSPRGDATNQEQVAQRILEHAHRAHRMLQALLDYSKPMEVNLREQGLADVVSSSIRSAQSVHGRADPPVKFTIGCSSKAKVKLDRDGFIRALENLLKNAAEAFSHPRCKQESPEVCVTVEDDIIEGLVRVKVSDNGPGLNPDEIKLLRKFRPGNRSNKTGSTGFGLANTARMVWQHHGSIQLDSDLGKGTIITILLPILQND